MPSFAAEKLSSEYEAKPPPFSGYTFKGTIYAGEEAKLSEMTEPGKKAGIAIYSVKFCPYCPTLFALVSNNSVIVYDINEATGKLECVLKLVDPDVNRTRSIKQNRKQNATMWLTGASRAWAKMRLNFC